MYICTYVHRYEDTTCIYICIYKCIYIYLQILAYILCIVLVHMYMTIPASSKVGLISAFCPINRFSTRTTFLGKPEFLLIYCCQARFSAAKMPDQTAKIPTKRRKYPTTWADNFSQRHLFSGTSFFRKNGDNSTVFEQRQK